MGSISTHAPSDAIIVPDAHLLFTGDFKRSGVDLILSAQDRELVLQDYFKGEKRVALASPDGAHLTGDIVNALAGYTQFAQADGSASVAPAVIGNVTKLTGNATAIRNGVSIILNQGDTVHKGDVVQSGSDSTLGITFIDGTVFGLASNAKMVLNEMIYDPNGSDNKSLLSLVQGTISFVAGATAKKGDMKVDTPVATMGIRGTAVLVEIDFEVPGQGGAPPAKFQVLVEPDGTTGSYILFDKTTLTPIATVNRAGTQTIINGQGGVSFQSSVQLSPDAQKIITDVFSLKFSDLNNPNTKLTTNFTDSIVPENFFFKLAGGDFVPVSIQLVNVPEQPAASPGANPGNKLEHIPGPPQAVAFGGASTELVDITASPVINSVSGIVNYLDINVGDVPTVSTKFASFTYQDAQQADVTATLTAEQVAAIQAVKVPLSVTQDPQGKNFGTAVWTYSIVDGAFDFLAAGETLKLTYMARVDNNFAPNNETTFVPFTITITGTNDKPTISASGGEIVEQIGTGITAVDTVTGTVVFTDADLTDRPVVTAAISDTDPFRYYDADGNDVTATLTTAQLAAILAVQVPLTVVQAAANTHNGTATWTYSIADSAFDFIADGETLTLNYVAKVDDGHGGVISTPITLTIQGGADVVIIGTNDVPTIVADLTTATDAVTEDDGATLAAGGTITFQDLDLTDTHTASYVLKSSNASADLPGYSETAPLGQIGTFTLADVDENPGVSTIGSIGWNFALNNSDPVLQSLAVGQTITQVYTVTVDDHHGGTVTQDVTVTITGTNDAPTIIADTTVADGAVTEDVDVNAYEIATSGTIAFRDVDLIDTHTASFVLKSSNANADLPGFAESTPFGQIGTFALTAVSEYPTDTDNRGSLGWTFELDNNDPTLQSLALNQTITQTYTVTLSDGHGGTVSQDVTVTITGTNDAPTIIADTTVADGAVTEDVDVNADEIATSGTIAFRDVDLIDTHTASFVLKSSNANADLPGFSETTPFGQIGTFALAAVSEYPTDTDNRGSLGWTFELSNNNSILQSLALNQTITQTYTVTLSDGHGGTVSQDVTVTITGTNDAPVVATTDVTGAVTELATPAGNLTDSGVIAFTDVDLTDTHSIAPTITASAGALGVLTASVSTDTVGGLGGEITWNYNVAASAIEYLAAGETKVESFTLTLNDGHGGTVERTIDVTITGTNDAPVVATADVTGAVTEQGTPAGDLTDGGTIAFTDVDLTDTHDIAPTITASAGALGELTADVSTDTVGGLGGEITWDYNVAASAVEYLAVGETKVESFTLTLNDGHGGTVERTIDVTVTGTNDAPVVATADVTGSVTEQGTPVGDLTDSGTIAFTDVDLTDVHLVSATGTPVGSVLGTLTAVKDSDTTGTGTGGQLTWTYTAPAVAFEYLAAGETKVESFTLTLSDGHGGTVERTIDVTITGTYDAPVFAAAPPPSAAAPVIHTDAISLLVDGSTTVYGLTVTDADATEDEAFSVTTEVDSSSAETTPSDISGTLSLINSILTEGVTYDPNENAPETDMVTLTVMDGGGNSDTVNFIFSQSEQGPLTLIGTEEKDVIFATGNDDTLTGGAGADQFVFAPEYDSSSADTITDFATGEDHIDLRLFSEFVNSDNIGDWLDSPNVSQVNSTDVLITLGDDTITLKNVALANLSSNDFILHPGGGGN